MLNKQAADAQLEEQRRHNESLEQAARGKGIEDDEEQIKQAIALLQGKGFCFC